jgi:hypothetical protein
MVLYAKACFFCKFSSQWTNEWMKRREQYGKSIFWYVKIFTLYANPQKLTKTKLTISDSYLGYLRFIIISIVNCHVEYFFSKVPFPVSLFKIEYTLSLFHVL